MGVYPVLSTSTTEYSDTNNETTRKGRREIEVDINNYIYVPT